MHLKTISFTEDGFHTCQEELGFIGVKSDQKLV